MRRVCATGTNLSQRKHNGFRSWALPVPNVRLALVWRSSGVYILTWKNAHILSMQKMCAEVDAHREWMTFIRRFRQIINEFRRTPSESQRTDQNSSFFGALDVRDGMCDWTFIKMSKPSCASFLTDYIDCIADCCNTALLHNTYNHLQSQSHVNKRGKHDHLKISPIICLPWKD